MARPATDPTRELPRVRRRGVRLAVVTSRYNHEVTGPLLGGAIDAFAAAGGDPDALTLVDAPGSFELLALCGAAARSGRFDGVVALGCIVKGQTRHDEYLAAAVTTGLGLVSAQTGVPIGLGVLTVETQRQALERAGGPIGNKGAEAMEAVLLTLEAMRSLGRRGR
ncbi:MAG: 6,7-dimethyl-8-ribityllumazine synthase [Phycisphaeraceae bacterium]|nr:6,7-dimethyl-8-ribityllumazine synthase [Phycisphaeraceae bacterium]